MSKTVKGFRVRSQQRRRVRGDLTGDYADLQWHVRSSGEGLFSWTIGKLSGFDGPTLADVLRVMKKAAVTQKKLIEEYGALDAETMKILGYMAKWERRILQRRLEVTGPHGSGDKSYYKVRVKPF